MKTIDKIILFCTALAFNTAMFVIVVVFINILKEHEYSNNISTNNVLWFLFSIFIAFSSKFMGYKVINKYQKGIVK